MISGKQSGFWGEIGGKISFVTKKVTEVVGKGDRTEYITKIMDNSVQEAMA